MAVRHTIVIAACVLGGIALQSSCTPQQRAVVASGLRGVAKGVDWLAAAIDVAETGAERYFDRHPNMTARDEVRSHLMRARLAQAALAKVLDAAQSKSLVEAQGKAVAAYRELYAVLEAYGVLDALSPAGGADGVGEPERFELPEPGEISRAIYAR